MKDTLYSDIHLTRFKPLCTRILNVVTTVLSMALLFTYMQHYDTNNLFILGILFPLENFVFLVLSERRQISFLKLRYFLVYLWSLVVFAACFWNSYICIEMIQTATYYAEE